MPPLLPDKWSAWIDKTNAFELTIARWENRPWYAKLGELVIGPLRPLF